MISNLLEGSSSSHDHDHEYKYDVFLSFRGFDTRLNFTHNLYIALEKANIATFFDDEEIQTGEDLKPELERAIKASRASIIVFSENYASSTWCLDELVLILDSKQIFYPIFYYVKPSSLRKKESTFGIAMAGHNLKMNKEENAEKKSQLALKIKRWEEKLTQVSHLKGKEAAGRYETDFIQEVVTEMYKNLGTPLRSISLPLLFGMEDSIEFITSWLNDGSSHTNDILTILGMSRTGKTSLAKYVHGKHRHMFVKSSFIGDVNKKYPKEVIGLQRELCNDIIINPILHYKVENYTSMIQNALKFHKVFLVLDDIGSHEQLYTLLGDENFHQGSKIIVTTNDASVTDRYKRTRQPKRTKLLLGGLHPEASLKLLSHHAFRGNGPKEGYEKVSKELIAYCDGHPWALESLGLSLCECNVARWDKFLKELKEEPMKSIRKEMEMSFKYLDSNDKTLFKHIACFFVGKDRNYTETILEACVIHNLKGIRNLIDRCLLTIGPRNELEMNKLLQVITRYVVRQESRDKPWKRSRLWCHEESFNVLKQEKGTRKIEGLVFDMKMLEKQELEDEFYKLKTDALSKMNNLMLLQLNHVQLSGSYEKFPQELRWLCMHGFPLKSIPSNLHLENLVSLDMSYSSFESLDMSLHNPQRPEKRQKLTGSCSKDNGFLRSLKILNLSFCEHLHSLGGFSELPALERLILANCVTLIEVSESIEQCDKLVHIDLSYCNKLERLPGTLCKLKNIETLILDGCNLGKFPIKTRVVDFWRKLKGNNITASLVKDAPKLWSFVISLPISLICLSLKSNNLSNNSFPMDFHTVPMLKELYLDGNDIVSLPNCVTNLPRLEKLSIEKCDMLKTFKHPPPTLQHLIFGSCCSIRKIVFDREMSAPPKLRTEPFLIGCSCYVIEGMFKVKAMTQVAHGMLLSFGWTNLEFIQDQQQVDALHLRERREVQMLYEFGIFSTIYDHGIEIQNWISHQSEGPEISFIMPSSPQKLRGLNFCYVVFTDYCYLPSIRISNITKKRTWIYNGHSYIHSVTSAVKSTAECVTFLSHWMFGKNEMEDGDQITISILKHGRSSVTECGVSFMYDNDDDDGKNKMEKEEDALRSYKSWNHIIGGDLFPILTTTELLDIKQSFGSLSIYCPFIEDICYYKERQPVFTAPSQRTSDIAGDASEEETD